MKGLIKKIVLMLLCLCSISASAVVVNKHGGGTAYPTVKAGEEIKPFYYSVIPGDCQIDVSNLAPGIKYNIVRGNDSTKVEIFGTAEDDIGKYKFRVTAEKDGAKASKSGSITISGDLIFTEDTEFLSQSLVEGDKIKEIKVYFRDGVTVSTLLQDGIEFYYDKENNRGVLYGVPQRKGMSYVRVYAERNGFRDTLFLNVEMQRDGLIKESNGNSKQIVHIDEEISPITLRWECKGNISYDLNANGINVALDQENKKVSIYGAPRTLGKHTALIKFETKKNVTIYKIEVIAIEDTEPTLYVVSSEETLDQIVPLRSQIDNVEIEIQDADSIAIEGLPEGIISSFDEDERILSIYGIMKENAAFEIFIKAYNKDRETVLSFHLSSIEGSGITALITTLPEHNIKIIGIEVYDFSGKKLNEISTDEFNDNILPKGISIVTIKTDKGKIVKKIMF